MAERFVLGLDLDGTCADFYGRMREIAAEWVGTDPSQLNSEPTWGLSNWGIKEGEYKELHRFAVTQRSLFETMDPIPGAPQAIRSLSRDGIRIRIITHRLFIPYFHEAAVAQTVRWLDHHAIPYWDLCFMKEKDAVGADLYVEDSPENIESLRDQGASVLMLDNSTNRDVPDGRGGRVRTWSEAETAIRSSHHYWQLQRDTRTPSTNVDQAEPSTLNGAATTNGSAH